LVLIPLSVRVIPRGDRVEGATFDIVGGVLLGLTAGLFLFGITQGQVSGFSSFISLGSFVGAVTSGIGFYLRITTARDPFVTPSLFANRGYVLAIAVGFFAMLGNVASLVMVPLLVTSVNGLSAGLAGLVLSPGAIALAVLSPMTGKLSDSIGVKLPIILGVGAMLASTVFLSSFGAGASPIVVSVGMMGIGIGFAFVSPSAVNAAANALSFESEHEIGAGLGIFQGAFFLGGGTGPAIIGAFLAARQEAGSSAINPVYPLSAPAFSDAFFAISLALAVSLAGAFFLKNRAANG
ncbi:MAG: MFS transporter, partial [Rubrobacter sp.]